MTPRIFAASATASLGLLVAAPGYAQAESHFPIGRPGQAARYRHEPQPNLRGSVVGTFTLALGPVETRDNGSFQWIMLDAAKADGKRFRLWLLSAAYPPPTLAAAQKTTARYIVQEAEEAPSEFQNSSTGGALLPSIGGWRHLFPRPEPASDELFRAQVHYLGQVYQREALEEKPGSAVPPPARVTKLRPDILVGLPSNTRQKDETRRYDGSDYELVPLTREDYREMVELGINCARVDARQLPWVTELNTFYWGPGANDLPYPECLYRSSYLGPAIFIDEPAVGTRDYVIRPKLAKDEAFRQAITPQIVFQAFQEHFRHAWEEGAATVLHNGLAARSDVALGDMKLLQENLFSWETVVSSAAYQLSQNPHVPAAMVFEPPGRVGVLRTLPELNMTYGCQLAVNDPKNFTDIIYGFLRGAARLTGKEWGVSIYGAVDRSDAFWLMTHAYDLGATKFFFWDNAAIACVPFHECLALARNLQARAQSYPHRDLSRLRHAAEVVILLPTGYNLGHVHLGKGSLWGLPELNLERLNSQGVKYRAVMSNFFLEIERCLRQGIDFDLLWDLPEIKPAGYREVIRIREDGKVEITADGKQVLLDQPRTPPRPLGEPPQLEINLSSKEGPAPLRITARAIVHEKSAPLFYTFGTDNKGAYQNAMVAWEIYGPTEADYRALQPPGLKPSVIRTNDSFEVLESFTLARPGHYRLRVSTVDLAGRTAIEWHPIIVTE